MKMLNEYRKNSSTDVLSGPIMKKTIQYHIGDLVASWDDVCQQQTPMDGMQRLR